MGTYTKIEIISCPSEAVAISKVDVPIKVTNLHTAGIHVRTVASFEYYGGSANFFWVDDEVIWAGESKTYSDPWFFMPPGDTEVRAVSSYLGTDGVYHEDDVDTKVVKLAVVEAKFSELKITNYSRT